MPPPQGSILIYGRDAQLLDTRRWILQRSGARVWKAATISDLDQIPPQESLDLILFCHSLPMEERGRALVAATSRWQHAEVLFLVSGNSGYQPGLSAKVVDASQGPEYLLQTVTRHLAAKWAQSSRISEPNS